MACQNKTVCFQHLPNYSAQQLVQANCNGQSMVAWKGKECKRMHVSHANLSTAEAKMHLFSCSCIETSTTGRPSFVLSLGTRRDREQDTRDNITWHNTKLLVLYKGSDFKCRMQSHQVAHSYCWQVFRIFFSQETFVDLANTPAYELTKVVHSQND